MPGTPIRSLLFCPGGDERKLTRAVRSGASLVVADLEDAVAEAEKPAARELVARTLASHAPDGAPVAVRINALDGPHASEDLAMVADARPAVVVVPKASAAGLEAIAHPDMPPLLAIVETPAALQESGSIAAAPGVVALLLGAVDLQQSLGFETRPDGLELIYMRSRLVIDSAAAGIQGPIDGVWTTVGDLDGLRAETELVRSLGFAGKACIHPAQIDVVNGAFRPAAELMDWARRVVSAYETAEAGGAGVTTVDGEMVDLPVVARARDILEMEHA